MRQQNTQNQTIPIEQLPSVGWKHKIELLDRLGHQLKLQESVPCPQQLENIWPGLLKETNLNVLQKSVLTLQSWVQVYGVKSVRIQRELVKSLIGLSKMGRPEIDSSACSTVIALFVRQTREKNHNLRNPLGLIELGRFNSSNNPTFLLGTQESQTMEQRQNQEEMEPQKNQEPAPTSFVLGMVIESMRTCQKSSFAMCLKILIALQLQNMLTPHQFEEIKGQVNEISEVIEHRRVPNSDSDIRSRRVDEEMALLLSEFRGIEQ